MLPYATRSLAALVAVSALSGCDAAADFALRRSDCAQQPVGAESTDANTQIIPLKSNKAFCVGVYRFAASQGHAGAQNNLGMLYQNGEGVSKNDAEAVRLYRRAAYQGLKQAQNNLAFAYLTGRGVSKNYTRAAHWFRLAADQGDAAAQYNLGVSYARGRGVPQNYAEAVRWYQLAAVQGFAPAQQNLGTVYFEGEGVPKSEVNAVLWYRRSADQGNALAQFNLGIMYANGWGVPKNDTEAYKWFNLSAAQGDSAAASRRDRIAARMTPAQIAEGQRRAGAWRPHVRMPRAQRTFGGADISTLARQVRPVLNCDLPGADAVIVHVIVRLSSSGAVVGQPSLVSPRSDPAYRAMSEAFLRGIRAAAPFDMPAGYEEADITFSFDSGSQC